MDNLDGKRPLYAEVISVFVVLFPAVDVVSAYPLYAYSLGNNIMSFTQSSSLSSLHDESNDTEDFETPFLKLKRSQIRLIGFRLLAAVPPILAAMTMLDLGSIVDYTGLAAFAIAFLFPAILAKYSAKRCLAEAAEVETIHSNLFSKEIFQNIFIMIALLLIVSVGFLLVFSSAS